MEGKIIKWGPSGNLVIQGKYSETQKCVSLRPEDIEHFKLEMDDKIEYDGKPYERVYVSLNITKHIIRKVK